MVLAVYAHFQELNWLVHFQKFLKIKRSIEKIEIHTFIQKKIRGKIDTKQ